MLAPYHLMPDTRGMNFYTADPAECAQLKANNAWQYEADAFFVNPAVNGQCPATTSPRQLRARPE